MMKFANVHFYLGLACVALGEIGLVVMGSSFAPISCIVVGCINMLFAGVLTIMEAMKDHAL